MPSQRDVNIIAFTFSCSKSDEWYYPHSRSVARFWDEPDGSCEGGVEGKIKVSPVNCNGLPTQ
jgi:hypothetical protein